MKKSTFYFQAILLAISLFIFSCETTAPGPWEDFMKCATSACVTEAIAVKDAFIKDPKAMLAKFDEAGQRGEDHFIGWLYIMRDSVLINMDYSPTEDRIAMQQAIINAAKPYENDPKYGELAQSIIGEVEMLAIASELEDDVFGYAPIVGTYAFELPNDAGSGELKVNIADDESIRFSLDVVAGPPAHNQGTLEGVAKMTAQNEYEFATNEYGSTCKISFSFQMDNATLKTLEGDPAACGFGNGVVADQTYIMKDADDPFLSAADAKTAKNLHGHWVSTSDPKSELVLENGFYKEIYEGKDMASSPYQFHPKCPKDCDPAGDFPCIAVRGQDIVCFAVVKVDNKSLELSMINGTGNTLAYKRK